MESPVYQIEQSSTSFHRSTTMKRSILISALLLVGAASCFGQVRQQRATNWCWAAAIQGVLGQAGISQSQVQISARLDGWPRNRPAYISEVVGLLQSYGMRAWSVGRPGSPQELMRTLRSGWKIIAFVRPGQGPVGHYIVLEGIDYYGNVIAGDPWNGQTRSYSLNDLYYRWRWADAVIVGTPY